MEIQIRKVKLEVFWLICTAFGAFVFLLPIKIYQIQYPFWISNVCYIFGAITCSRWFFLWKYTPYAWNIPLKIAFIGILFIAFILGFDRFHHFKYLINDIGIQELVQHLPVQEQDKLAMFIRSEMIFWATAFFGSTIVLVPKIFWSIWKQVNRNEV